MNIRKQDLDQLGKNLIININNFYGKEMLSFQEIDEEDDKNPKGYLDGIRFEYIGAKHIKEDFCITIWEDRNIYFQNNYDNGTDYCSSYMLGIKGNELFLENPLPVIIKYIEYHKSIYENN